MLQWNVEDGISDAVIAEKVEDLDFRAVVRACDLLILVGAHVEAVAKLSWDDAYARRAPEEAKLMCAFFRVWCLVELASALEAKKPVVMLVGAAAPGDALAFKQNVVRNKAENSFYVSGSVLITDPVRPVLPFAALSAADAKRGATVMSTSFETSVLKLPSAGFAE